MKRVIALLLVLCFIGLALAACGGDDKKTVASKSKKKTTGTNKYGEVELGESFDWTKVGKEVTGETLNILVRDNDQYVREFGLEDIADEQLDMAILERNGQIEKTLGIETVITRASAPNGYDEMEKWFVDVVSTDVSLGTHVYDIVAHFAYVALNASLRDCNANLADKDTFPYFDFSLICWNQNIVKNTLINDKIYCVAGNMNLSTFNASMIMWHNKDLYNEVKSKIPNAPDDIQDLAIEGEWTYADLYDIASYYENKDMDGVCGDYYGIILNGGREGLPMPIDAIPYAWDLDIMTTNKDGTHEYNIIGNKKLTDAITMYNNLYKLQGNGQTAYDTVGKKTGNGCGHNHFVTGNAIFAADIIYRDKDTNLAIRNMEQRFALLPIPKFDNAQDRYATTTQDSYTLMVALDHSAASTATKGEAVSAYLQYATELSYEQVYLYYLYEIVIPTYFGTVETVPDDPHIKKSVSILRLLLEKLEFDYWTIYSPLLNNAVWLFRDACATNKNIVDVYTKNRTVFDNAVKETDEWLGLIK